MSVNEDFCEYLKQGEFEAFMVSWKHQVIKLGTVGGTVSVPLTPSNQAELEGLLGKSFKGQASAKVSWSTLKKAIQNSRFEGADFKLVLEQYFDMTFVNKAEKKALRHERILSLFEDLRTSTNSTRGLAWLDSILESQSGVFQRVKSQGSLRKAYNELKIVIEAMDCLPVWHNEIESVAVFAAVLTGDPHALDYQKSLSYFFIQALKFLFEESSSSSILEKNDLLLKAGLIKEEAHNFCTIYGLVASKNGLSHPGWLGFYNSQEMWNTTVGNLGRIDEIDRTFCHSVIVFENATVFEVCCQAIKNHHYDGVGCICIHGQPKNASYALLDKIQLANIRMYYCGDFDPEGLMIAQKLLNRYDSMALWCYTIDDYMLQSSKEYAAKRRLKMLDNLQDIQLIEIAEMIRVGPVGYQENMIAHYLDELKILAKTPIA